jgi:hypothetical protein
VIVFVDTSTILAACWSARGLSHVLCFDLERRLLGGGGLLRFEIPADADAVQPAVNSPRDGAAWIDLTSDDKLCVFHARVATSAGQLGFG